MENEDRTKELQQKEYYFFKQLQKTVRKVKILEISKLKRRLKNLTSGEGEEQFPGATKKAKTKFELGDRRKVEKQLETAKEHLDTEAVALMAAKDLKLSILEGKELNLRRDESGADVAPQNVLEVLAQRILKHSKMREEVQNCRNRLDMHKAKFLRMDAILRKRQERIKRRDVRKAKAREKRQAADAEESTQSGGLPQMQKDKGKQFAEGSKKVGGVGKQVTQGRQRGVEKKQVRQGRVGEPTLAVEKGSHCDLQLHPSWAAKRQQAVGMAKPQGKKIAFDD